MNQYGYGPNGSVSCGETPNRTKNRISQKIYEMAWTGIKPGLRITVKTLTTNGRFRIIDERFDSAAAAGFQSGAGRMRGRQQHPQKQLTGDSGGSGESYKQTDMNHNVTLLISKPAETTSAGNTAGDGERARLLPTPWVPRQVLSNCIANTKLI
ncbi:hypothetical protein BDD12DRAFT_903529 [Trichophaea hybrida]|nr:hypothetical protein BDD12DRAFT_903529 [Trichophaea hybrida]